MKIFRLSGWVLPMVSYQPAYPVTGFAHDVW